MKPTYRLYQRGKIFYCQHNETGQQESLHTCDGNQATRREAS